MKKTNIILSFVICILLYGCTDLSETVYTGVAMNDFFKNEKELVANAGRAYTKLQGYNSEQSLWTLLLTSSLRHPKRPDSRKAASMTYVRGSAS